MANKYRKGADYERKIVNELRDAGFIAARSAGSKSPIDVWAINEKEREILLVQAKKGKPIPKAERTKIQTLLESLEGNYTVKAELWEGD